MKQSGELLKSNNGFRRLLGAGSVPTPGVPKPVRRKSEFQVAGPIPFSGLLTNKLLMALPGEDFARLLPHLEPVSLIASQELSESGEHPKYIHFPETAVLSLVFFLEDGSSTGSALVGKDGLVGLSAILFSRPPAYRTHVVLGGTALRAKVEVIREEFARGGVMQQLLLSYTSIRLAQISQRAVCNGRHNLGERLCTWLLMMQDRTAETELPLTHEQISADLGARRAGITSACNALKYNRVIDYRRGRIRIIDRGKLEIAACECYSAIKNATALT